MGELLSIRDVVKRYDQDNPVYTVARPHKKQPQKVSAKAYDKGQKESAKATASKKRK